MRQWHLIYDSPTDGPRNMAVDDAILTAVSEKRLDTTLRLYAWKPPCLSLGYGQSIQDADEARLAEMGWHVVRRMTGGKAILHTDELTYSLAFAADDPLAAGGIIESYRRISAALMVGVERLGLQARAEKMSEGVKISGPVCFETPSHYEITTRDGKKLIGSAQVRRKGGVLQHGTLPLSGDVGRICDALVYHSAYEREEARGQVRSRAATLTEALGVTVTWEAAAAAIVAGFQDVFDVEFIHDDISQMYAAEAERLRADVYGQVSWTRKH